VYSRRLLAACISAAFGGMLLSIFIHSPWSSPSFYSDIQSFWYTRPWLQLGQVPYSSFSAFLEYPPISGLILYVSRVVGVDYSGYYLIFSLVSLWAAVILAWSTWRLAGDLGVKASPLYFILPSMIVYGVYNFDLFNALFIVLGLLFFVEKKRDLSAVFIGLAIATKLVAVILIPVLIFEVTGWDKRVRYLLVCAVATAIPFLPIVFANPGFFSQFLSYYKGWGLEDAWYVWIFGDPLSGVAKLFGIAILIPILLRVYTLKAPLATRCFLALSGYFLASYIYAPQFSVALIPLVVVLALNSPALFSWEVFNALIILTWFTVTPTPTSGPTYPWTLPQTMALLRSASLAVLSVQVASASGNSLILWLRRALGVPGTRQTTLPISGSE
jgi:uncharacterized membrane protein